MNESLPWHGAQWQSLRDRLFADKLPHALLLSGPAGIGKNQFAERWARTLLCENGAVRGEACGECRSCMLYAAGSHPDLRIVAPQETGKIIGVDQIRELSQYLTQTSQYGGHKAVIITPADKMNINAANSLLKTLEEPSQGSLILLVTDHPGRLTATVLSRCQRINFTLPKFEYATRWLAGRIDAALDPALLLSLAEGAPLRALELAADKTLMFRTEIIRELVSLAQGEAYPSAVAEQFLKIGVQETLYWMCQWVAAMIRFSSCGDERYLVNHDITETQIKLADRIGLQGLHRYFRQMTEVLSISGGQANPQLMMEDLLVAWQDNFPLTRGL